MSEFFKELSLKVASSINNNYLDNYDEERFGKAVRKRGLKNIVRNRINQSYIPKERISTVFKALSELIGLYGDRFEYLYHSLSNNDSKKLLIDIWAYRLLKERHVKLKTNSFEYWETLKSIKQIEDKSDSLNPGFIHFTLNKFDLRKIGKEITMYFTAGGILVDFILEQYRYLCGDVLIEVEKDDIVIDAGGCWGDTALYFAHKSKGMVYSFEFIPSNIEIFKRNVDLNPQLAKHIELIDRPLWSESNQKVYFSNNGPASIISANNFQNAYGSAFTICIDDLVTNRNLTKVDFIKMDIEGAELEALKGAVETIRKFKPKLAISIYHNTDDFVNIPRWINELNLGYKLYLDHFTIHTEETVLFAISHD